MLTSPRRDMLKLMRKKMDLARKLQEDLKGMIAFAVMSNSRSSWREREGKAGKGRLILLFGSRCYSDRTSARVTMLINSCPMEGLERGNFYKIISAVG